MAELCIAVSHGCAPCDRARLLAEKVRRDRPEHRVVLLELGSSAPPEGMPGTPTYLIDGAVTFLGNPEPGELLSALDSHHPDDGTGEHR